MSRPIYGYVYELFLAGQPDTDHSYVGMTTTTIHRRIHGPGGHASAESVARDPWKARILPGRAGYRCLEIVRDTGDPAENDRALRRAEAFWIDRLRPVHNDVRPVRPPGEPVRSRRESARVGESRRKPRPRGNGRPVRRRRPWPVIALALFVIPPVVLVARVVSAMELPWPAAPWIAAPTVGTLIGWNLYWRARRGWRRLTR